MQTFTDNAGRTWALLINVAAIKRVLNDAGLIATYGPVNLANLSAGTPPLVARLATDLVFVSDVLFALVRPEARERGVDEVAFGAALDGAALKAGMAALQAELHGFFLSLGQTDVAAVLHQQARAIDEARQALEQQLQQTDLAALVTAQLGAWSGNSPAVSGSTPAP